LFLEHVHLTWEGNYAVARLLAAAAHEALFGAAAPAPTWLDPSACAEAVGYTEFGHYSVLQGMDKLTGRPPFTGQLSYAADRTRMARQLAASTAALSVPGALSAMAAKVHQALNRDPENPDLMYQAALLDLQTGDKAGALRLLDRLAELLPFAPEQAVFRTLVLQSLGRGTEAEPWLRRAIAAEPYYFQSYGLLAQLWAETGRTDQAVEYISGLLQRMPESRSLRLTYVQLLLLKEDWGAAEAQWRLVLARSPDDEAALGPLTRRLAATGRVAEAVGLMQAAHAHNPRSLANNRRLVEYHEARGEQVLAQKYRADLAASGPR
jgi:tetratricopeptide (TPR) repeat protein